MKKLFDLIGAGGGGGMNPGNLLVFGGWGIGSLHIPTSGNPFLPNENDLKFSFSNSTLKMLFYKRVNPILSFDWVALNLETGKFYENPDDWAYSFSSS